jgi:hypothetical protein
MKRPKDLWLRIQVQSWKSHLSVYVLECHYDLFHGVRAKAMAHVESSPQPLAPTFGRGCELQQFQLRLIGWLCSFVSGDCSDCALRFCGM